VPLGAFKVLLAAQQPPRAFLQKLQNTARLPIGVLQLSQTIQRASLIVLSELHITTRRRGIARCKIALRYADIRHPLAAGNAQKQNF
jgi:hypothetical protein